MVRVVGETNSECAIGDQQPVGAQAARFLLDKQDSLNTIYGMITTVTGKNQITIPAKIAHEAGIQVGTRIDWAIGGEGVLIARLLPARGTLARQVAGMGRAWLREGEDPVAALLEERSESA